MDHKNQPTVVQAQRWTGRPSDSPGCIVCRTRLPFLTPSFHPGSPHWFVVFIPWCNATSSIPPPPIYEDPLSEAAGNLPLLRTPSSLVIPPSLFISRRTLSFPTCSYGYEDNTHQERFPRPTGFRYLASTRQPRNPSLHPRRLVEAPQECVVSYQA
jgi:hypothetical protein